MTDWYYHDPAEGRIGPLPADDLLARYRDRRVQLDTLVWHAGLREWSTLERQAEALALHSVVPDAAVPPPLPRTPLAPPRSPHRASAGAYGRVPPGPATQPPKQGMSGCLIALLVCAALFVPVAGILAAIAVPAYQDYVVRSKVLTALAQAAPLQAASESQGARGNACVRNGEGGIGTPRSYASATVASIETGTFDDGHCGIAITLRGHAVIAGKHLWLTQAGPPSSAQWTCSSDLKPALLPASCRAP